MQLPIAAIFDLDGVLVDTAKYHYLAWKNIAERLGIIFTHSDNEQLKGVSRDRSLDIILHMNQLEKSTAEKEYWLAEKNTVYLDYIRHLTPKDVLPGALELIQLLKSQGKKISLGSASKNAQQILAATGLATYFDAVVDGNCVTRAKPDPQVFLLAAQRLGVKPQQCTVFEDARAGVDAALAAHMSVVGVGEFEQLGHADWVVSDLHQYLTQIT